MDNNQEWRPIKSSTHQQIAHGDISNESLYGIVPLHLQLQAFKWICHLAKNSQNRPVGISFLSQNIVENCYSHVNK